MKHDPLAQAQKELQAPAPKLSQDHRQQLWQGIQKQQNQTRNYRIMAIAAVLLLVFWGWRSFFSAERLSQPRPQPQITAHPQPAPVDTKQVAPKKLQLLLPEQRALVKGPSTKTTIPLQPAKIDRNPKRNMGGMKGIARRYRGPSKPAASLGERNSPPSPKEASPMNIEGLLDLADAARRKANHQQAEILYGQVMQHPRGKNYFEEALLRRARSMVRLGRQSRALALLQEHRGQFSQFGPELLSLEVELLAKKQQYLKAYQRINGQSLSHHALSKAALLLVEELFAQGHQDQAQKLLQRLPDTPKTRQLQKKYP